MIRLACLALVALVPLVGCDGKPTPAELPKDNSAINKSDLQAPSGAKNEGMQPMKLDLK